jgi:hypothetical protein
MASIGYTADDGRLEVIEFDVLEQHGVTHAAKATQFPVETGAVITDHVLQDPDVVQLTGLVTNAPLPANVAMGYQYDAFISAAAGGQFKGRAQAAYHALVRAKEAGQAVTIDTPLRWYEGMVIESLAVSESTDSGDSLTFSLSARQIRTTSTRTAAAPKLEAAKPKVEKGRQPAKKVEGGRLKSAFKAGKELVFTAP